MKYAVVFSETGCDAVVEADSVIEAIRKVDPIFRYSSEFSEWPEYDKFSVAEKGGGVEKIDAEKCKGVIDWIKEVGKDDKENGYPSLAHEDDFTVFIPTKGDQSIYVYQTNHPACECYYKFWEKK